MKRGGNIFYMIERGVVLSAGYSKRLRPLSFFIPKPLIKIKGKPIIIHIFDNLKNLGVKKIYVNLYYKKDKIEKIIKNSEYKDIIFIFKEKELMGTGGGVKNFEKYIEGDFILHNCDIYHKLDLNEFVDFHFKNSKIGTLLLTFMETKSEVVLEGNLVKDIKIHKRKNKFLTYAGISIFKKEIFRFIPEGKSDLLDVFFELMKYKELAGFKVKEGLIFDIGSFKTLFNLYLRNY